MHILEISIFSLNHVIVRPTKIMNNLLKVCKICTFKVIFQHQKSTESFWIFFCEEYLTRRSTFINEVFWKLWFLKYSPILFETIKPRYRPRFFNQIGHQTMSAYIENKHFFTKSCHRQTNQNYEQPPQSLQNLYFQSHFSASKINQIFLIFFSVKNIWLGDQLL